MFGIPTLETDYSNDIEVFNPDDQDQFKIDPCATKQSNLYRLHKAMVKAYREAKLPVRVAKEVASRNATQILERLLNPPVESPAGE